MDITSKSCEQRLTYVAMHTNFILLFKLALYSSTLVIISAEITYSYCNTIGQSSFYKLCYLHGTPTFIAEVLCLVHICSTCNNLVLILRRSKLIHGTRYL